MARSAVRVHLTKYDVATLRQQAAQSEELGDEGEIFSEEAIGCFEESEIDMLEELYGGSAEDLFMEVFSTWEGAEPELILETLTSALAELDVELTYEEDDDVVDEYEDDADWVDADEEEEEEEVY